MKELKLLMSLILILLLPPLCVTAQENIWKAPSKFNNIGFCYTTMSQKDSPDIKSNFGISFNTTRTYYLHKPIAGRLRFGIEIVWCDLTYSNYKVNYISMLNPADSHRETFHVIDYTLQAGVAINFNINSKSSLHGYFRYSPGCTAMHDGDNFKGGFFNGASGGALINYRKIGAGIECRFGQSRIKNISLLPEDSEPNVDETPESKVKTNINGLRAYISFLF